MLRATEVVIAGLERDPLLAGRRIVRDAQRALGTDEFVVLAFVAGPSSMAIEAVAGGMYDESPRVRGLVAGMNGLLVTPPGVEPRPHAAALAFRTPATVCAIGHDDDEPADVGRSLAAHLGLERGGATVVMGSPSQLQAPLLQALAPTAKVVVGGGVRVATHVAAVTESGVSIGCVGAVRFSAATRVAVSVSSGVKPTTPPLTVGRVDEGFVLDLDGRPSLAILEECLPRERSRTLTLAVLRPGDAPAGAPSVVRGISGVDPHRRAVHLGADVRPGDVVYFGHPDPALARTNLTQMVRELSLSLSGGAPFAALLIESVARASRLYGVRHLAITTLRRELHGVPLVGVSSTVEVVPFQDAPRRCTHTAEAVVFYAPN